MKSSSRHFKKHIAYQIRYMLHLLFTWSLSNYSSWKFAEIPFIAGFNFSVRESVKRFIFGLRNICSFTRHYAAESFFLQSPFSDW